MHVAPESGDYVHVGVEDVLSGFGLIIDVNIDPVSARRLFNDSRELMDGAHDGHPFGFVYIENVTRWLFRDDERVTGIHGVYIEKRKSMFVLVEYLRRELAADNLAEYSVFHMRQGYRAGAF